MIDLLAVAMSEQRRSAAAAGGSTSLLDQQLGCLDSQPHNQMSARALRDPVSLSRCRSGQSSSPLSDPGLSLSGTE